MKSELPFKDFVGYEKGPFPRVGFLFCESERVRVVDPEELKGFDPEEILEFTDHKTLIKGVKIGEPLVGELWLKYLTVITETTLENINKIGEEYRAYHHSSAYEKGSPEENRYFKTDQWAESVRESIVRQTIGVMLMIMSEGPSAFKVTSGGEITYTETFTDYEIDDRSMLTLPKPAEKAPWALPLAIALISYWQRHGYPQMYCPIATLLGQMYDCGLFSLLPMFNTDNLEQLRPSVQECRRVYGLEASQLYLDLFNTLLDSTDDPDENTDRALSSASAMMHRMLKEEWFNKKAELPNEEEPEVEASED